MYDSKRSIYNRHQLTTNKACMMTVSTIKKVLAAEGVATPVKNSKAKSKSSYIPKLKPTSYSKLGVAVYSEAQLAAVKDSIPNPKTESNLEDREKVISQIEVLMLRGVISPTLISQIIEVPLSSVYLYVKAISVRWDVLGGAQKHTKLKGEALAKLTLLESELWTLYSNAPADHTAAKAGVLKHIMEVIERKLLIHGLSPRVLENSGANLSDTEGIDSPREIMRQHASVVGILSKVMQGIADKTEPLTENNTGSDIVYG